LKLREFLTKIHVIACKKCPSRNFEGSVKFLLSPINEECTTTLEAFHEIISNLQKSGNLEVYHRTASHLAPKWWQENRYGVHHVAFIGHQAVTILFLVRVTQVY
jgi:hypothetical protein